MRPTSNRECFFHSQTPVSSSWKRAEIHRNDINLYINRAYYFTYYSDQFEIYRYLIIHHVFQTRSITKQNPNIKLEYFREP